MSSVFKRSVSYRPIPPRNWLGRDLECDSRCGRVATYAQFECLVNSGRGIRARHFLSTRIEKLKQFRPTFLRILDLCLHRKLKERDIEIYFAPNRRVSSLSRRGSRFNQIVQLVARCTISATVCSRSNELNGVNRFRDLISSINLSLFFSAHICLAKNPPAATISRATHLGFFPPRHGSTSQRLAFFCERLGIAFRIIAIQRSIIGNPAQSTLIFRFQPRINDSCAAR